MKFNFSLEPVLKVRKHKEKLQKQKLAEKLSAKEQINSRQENMKQKLENYLANTDSSDFKNVHTIKRHSKHMQQTSKKIEELNGQLKKAEHAVSEEREKLVVANQKRHMMEKVKEKERKHFLEKLSKLEQKTMDEIATQTYSH